MAGFRVSVEEAERRGWTKGAKKNKGGSNADQKKGRKQTSGKTANTGAGTPQHMLYEALILAAKDKSIIRWEVKGTIPGRDYEVDIMVGPRLVINVNGWQFHSAKERFLEDQRRSNAFLLHGYFSLNYGTADIRDETQRALIVNEILETAEQIEQFDGFLDGAAAGRYASKVVIKSKKKDKGARWDKLPDHLKKRVVAD